MKIQEFFENNKSVVVALSGGVDSAVLLYLATKYAENAYAVFVKSELQPEFEMADAREICMALGVGLEVITTHMLENESITSNGADRCYHCKKHMLKIINEFAKERNAVVIEGTNADDDINNRAGYKALCEMNILSPLRLCGYTKADIRKIAIKQGLCVADKPSYACLATRIPKGNAINSELLRKTEKAENELFALGFKDFRIRYINSGAVLEFSAADREKYLKNQREIDTLLMKHYKTISLSREIRNGTG